MQNYFDDSPKLNNLRKILTNLSSIIGNRSSYFELCQQYYPLGLEMDFTRMVVVEGV